ncbi:hypothetical protein LSH36_172g03013 [Paralvinella palmiformis]|uniref:NECAP PHear domain-containing protein n=1 Tax=Paralvinella palmiformis TaxID=53620 RepID=A0AAD9JUA6_9ANNE|nr:hypothetical protein LSH36_172g03013 [Paralvinella palmiformis]
MTFSFITFLPECLTEDIGELFAQCLVESYPGTSVEPVLDSNRYFVIRIQDDHGDYALVYVYCLLIKSLLLNNFDGFYSSDHKAFIGLGFADRADSFDLLVAIQDHFRWMEREELEIKEQQENADLLNYGQKLDLGFKEGQTIRIQLTSKLMGVLAPRLSQSHQDKVPGSGLLPPPASGHIRGAHAIRKKPSETDDEFKELLFSDNFAGPSPEQEKSSSSKEGTEGLSWNFETSCSVHPFAETSDNNHLQDMDKLTQSTESWADFTTDASSSNLPDQHIGNWVSFEG